MKGKLVSIAIIFAMIVGSFGAVGVSINTQNNENPLLATSTGSNVQAFIVGIADYPGYGSDLQWTDDDAIDMRNLLIFDGDWHPDDITLYLDSTATKSAIKNKLDGMASSTNSDSLSLFYFSGHGGQDENGETICCYDSEMYDTELNEILNKFNGRVLVILDTCHSGGMDPDGGEGNQSDFNATIYVQKFLETFSGNQKLVMLMACEADKYSYENSGLENGVFTYYVIEGFEGNADKNDNWIITAEEAFAYAKPKTEEFTEDFLFQQHPQLYDGDTSTEISLIFIKEPDLECRVSQEFNLEFGKVEIGDDLVGKFYIRNDGETGSKLHWEVDTSNFPSVGRWSMDPSGGNNWKPEYGEKEVVVTIKVEKDVNFDGFLKVYNVDDPADKEFITFKITTPRNRAYGNPLFQRIFDLFPILLDLLNIR